MKFIFYSFSLLFSISLFSQSFTTGNIAVLVAAASANNTTASVVELTPGAAGQTAVNTYSINGTTAPNALRFSGSATSTGYLANSNDGSLLCFAGHNTTTTSVNANTITARGVGTYNASGTFILATNYTGANGDQTRCATSLNNTNWFIADQGGLYTNGATAASPSGNFRSIKPFGGVVYVASASGTATVIQVNTVSAPSGGTVTGLPGLTNNAALQDFYLVSSGSNGAAYDVLYILSATSNTAGTISKYSLVNASWVANGSYTTTFGGFGLAAQKNGTGATLFVSTGQGAATANSLLQLADAADYNAAISITTASNITLYTTATGTIIKGVAFAPVATVAPSVSASPSTLNFSNTVAGAASAGQTVTLTAANLSPASGSLTATVPNANFQVSNDGTTWASSATIAYSNGGSAIGNFQVRFTPQTATAQSGNVAITGDGITNTVNVAVSGTGISSLALSFSAATTPLLNPPYVSTTISDASDPAQQLGIVTDVKNNNTAVAAANYTLTAASSNTTVLPNANIAITKADGQATIKITPAAVGYANVTLTLTSGGNSTTLVINYAASTASGTTSGTHWHTGTSDASAAIAIDNNYMITADDEKNILYVHSRSQSGLPATTFDYNQNNVLALTDGRELDTEAGVASPTVPGKVYLTGSMSNGSNSPFADRPSRNRIIAVTVTGTGAATTFANAGYYAGLRQQLITWGDNYGYNFSASAATGKDPKFIDGFNIEGMVFAPDNATLYMGFRAPLVPTANRTKAVIAPVQNFETFFNNGAPSGNPTIGAPIELDLGGRGIRDIFRLSNGSYIILAGSYDGTSNPAVYSWTGNATDAAMQLTDYNVTGLNVEGGMQINENGQMAPGKLQLISDDGDNVFYGDGIAAKDLTQNNYKKFRSDIVISSTILPLNFTAFTATKQSDKVALTWAMAQPDNAVSFTIYRSVNGRDFTAIHTVNAARSQALYSYTDDSLAGKMVYYRIKAKEASGKEIWSAVRIINSGVSGNEISIYPNPVSGNQFTVASTQAGTKTVQVFTGTGVLYKLITFQSNAKEISTSEWPKGFYSIRITTAQNAVTTKEIIIQ